MGIWAQDTETRLATIDLGRGNTPTWKYKLNVRERGIFLESTTAFIEFKDSYGRLLGTWQGFVNDGVVVFPVDAADGDDFPRGTTFAMTIHDLEGKPRIPLRGHVIRSEARYPDSPDNTNEFAAVQYDYVFETPGRVVDPSWRVMNGAPRVWNNTGKPNGVACGTLFDDAAMLWYAPFGGDSIEINYSLVVGGAGRSGIALCSNYQMTNYILVAHETGIVNNKLWIETGRGPVTTNEQVSVAHHNQNNDNLKIVYNHLTKTVSVYETPDLATPLLEWTDNANIVHHGPGERYYGMNWRSSLMQPGIMFTSVRAQDAA